MNRRRRVFEGRSKVLYEGPEPGTLIQHFKDDIPGTAGKKSKTIDGKGVLNSRICEYLYKRLGEIGIPNHFLKRLNMREQLIQEVEIIPIKVTVRNVATGRFSERLGIEEGTILPRSIIEYTYNSNDLDNPLVTEEHITAFGWASPQELDEMMALSLRINDFLSGLFLGIGIRLIDFTIEFGRYYENEVMRILLADEISPDCCRLWDVRTGSKLDKDLSGAKGDELVEAYHEVARRLGILFENGPSKTRGPVLVKND